VTDPPPCLWPDPVPVESGVANLLDIDNQVPLCNLHNSWVEDRPDKAHWLGLSRHAWEKP
jgi:hypothetical protein